MLLAKAIRDNEGVQMRDTIPALDRAQLRGITMDDEQLMREIVDALIDDTARQVGLLDAAIRASDAANCKRLAHYSKGACANVGANRAAGLFRDLERNAASGNFRACAALLDNLAGEIELLRQEII